MEERKISLALAFLRERPKSAASTLEQHDVRDVVEFLESIPVSYGSTVLECMIPHFAARICKTISPTVATSMLATLEPNQVANILRYSDKQKRQDVLQALPAKSKRTCKLLLSFSQNSIGAWISPSPDTIPLDYDVEQVLEYLKKLPAKSDSAYLYVLDRENLLVGRIHYTDILKSPPSKKIETLLEPNCPSLHGRTQVNHAAEDALWESADALPVVNQKGHFVGIMRHLDLRKALAFLSAKNATQSADPILDNNIVAYGGALLACFHAMGDMVETDTRA